MTGPEPSAADPCKTCPWRTSNHDQPHPEGWYRRGNLDRLWKGLRDGESMSCHPTDPDNPVSEAAQAAGYRPAPPGTQRLECRGGAILQQREIHLFQTDHDGDLRAYRKARPSGMTRYGLQVIVLRLAFGGVPFIGGPPMARPDLNAPVGYRKLPWTNITPEQQ